MPIYEYVCKECNTKFERLTRVAVMTETADCPECHNTGVKVPSTFASIMASHGTQTLPMSDTGGCACGGNCGCGSSLPD